MTRTGGTELGTGTNGEGADAAAVDAVSFTIVVPCYNEEDGVAETVERLRASLASAGRGDGDYELLIVNDGSGDNTPAELARLEAVVPNLTVLHHPRNRGYGAALKTGISHARHDLIVITDADGTYPNERIPELVRRAVEKGGADMVVGARTADDVTYPLIRKIPKAFLRRYAQWISNQPIPDMNSGLRCFRAEAVTPYFHILPDGFSFTTTITIAMLTNYQNVRWMPIGYAARVGKSKIKPVRDTLRFFQLILRTGMYFAPLRILMPVVLSFGLATLVSGVYDIFWRQDLTEKTLILLTVTLNAGMFALLSDMLDKRGRGVPPPSSHLRR